MWNNPHQRAGDDISIPGLTSQWGGEGFVNWPRPVLLLYAKREGVGGGPQGEEEEGKEESGRRESARKLNRIPKGKC